jgi:hypothetical protein
MQHVMELQDMIDEQAEGPAKRELEKVLTNSNRHVKDLKEHVSLGQKLVQ